MSQTKRYSNEEILEMLRTCKERYGKCPPRLFKDDEDFCSVSVVMRRFGSWKEAKEEAGIEEDLSSDTGRKKEYSDEQILSQLRECKRRNGKCTTELLQSEDDLIGATVAVDRFGSWLEAKKEAGLEEDERSSNSRPQKYSDEEYLDMVRECREKHGKVTQRIFDNDDEFASSAALRKRFGSWADAKEKAGVGNSNSRQKYAKSDLIEMLQQCARRYDSCSAQRFASDGEFCSPETVQRHFGSWSDAKKEAGVE